MSNTDLEDDLRGTFDRAAASVPMATDLTGRATTDARRAQRRTWMISAAAAVAVASIAAATFGLSGGRSTPVQLPVAGGNAPASTSAVETEPSVETVSGTWRPVQMAGLKALSAERPEDPVLVFRPDGTWTGSDGCNGLQGTYNIGQRGEFTAKAGMQRLIGCDNVPHTGVLQSAKRIAVDASTLEFYGADGRELARYARAR
ncbi:heat shock protein HslJ [Kribbella antiqua]|uniref:Heat shock protein HslJ n=1 Tax=Kribbella antiqua TaxID=2512217 RepID=A0A4V2S4J3_9ACTN|nr:META domain-containing protein [Kribbella antiqua]TCO48480.1 heat shock protein HslJ [Kribbella antiqua]